MSEARGGREFEPAAGFTALPDLASRAFGGSVIWANDEFFADKENLINPAPPVFRPATFTSKGQQYDGWETRRRRPGAPGVAGNDHDSAIIRLGAPGLIRGVVIDTAHFLGNYPPRCSLEATWCGGYPSPKRLLKAQWTQIVPPHPLGGGQEHHIPVNDFGRRFSHVRLNLLPDGGVARLRVHGEPLPDPDFLDGVTVNLASLSHGARVSGCSDMFFGHADNMLMPGLARTMGEGWENARRRDGGNDWAEIRLLGEGIVRVLEIDTTHYKGNAPHKAKLSAARIDGDRQAVEGDWSVLLSETKLQPDTAHRFLIRHASPATHLRLDIYPDGGVARLRAIGALTPAALEELRRRWKLTG
ncbi:MAG TPA: allantoicase [Actinocrinis sp.]|nr:allantoicase [Actinocrinis sp.]